METEPQVEMSHSGTLLHFRKPTEKDSGNYTCSTRNDSKVVYVLIKSPLDFMDTPPLQRAIEFQQAFVIKCEVKGGIRPTITWYTSKGEVTKPKFAVLADGLAINNVTMKDAGIYICKATERYTGAMKEKNITLRVELISRFNTTEAKEKKALMEKDLKLSDQKEKGKQLIIGN
ncbi:Immunoglobulin I-set domain [Popillia japonica]|uniref:Immunoglobulin I-set domain n=1 Tax=Popillia japonica TaxID=7064 RepID=A0AAW1MJJ0_POPJA